MATLHRLYSYPPNNGFSFIFDVEDREEASTHQTQDPNVTYARPLESCATPVNGYEADIELNPTTLVPVGTESWRMRMRCANKERGRLPVAASAPSPAQPTPCAYGRMPFLNLSTCFGFHQSPFGMPEIQYTVIDVADAKPQPSPGEDAVKADLVLQRGSCKLGAPDCIPNELPVAPAEPAPAAQPEALALPERASATALFVDNMYCSTETAIGPMGQQQQDRSATPAASSVCRHGVGMEDTDDGDDAVEEITTTAAALADTKRAGMKRTSSGCLPSATMMTMSERATSTAEDEMPEAVDAVEGATEERGEPELSVQGASPRGRLRQAVASQAPSANGPTRIEFGEEDGYTSAATVVESPHRRRAAARGPGRGRAARLWHGAGRGSTVSAAVAALYPQHPIKPCRGARRAAAEAAAVVAATARLDVVEEETEDEEMEDEDADEEYVVRGRGGRGAVGNKRRRNGAATARTRGRMASGSVCLQCGVTSTPQWRQGPEGPCTLCNACGVRYMKDVKEQSRGGRQRR